MSHPPTPSRGFAVKAAVFEGVLAIVALITGALLGVDPMSTLKSTWTAIGLGLAATVPPVLVLLLMPRLPWHFVRHLLKVVDELLVPAMRSCTVAELGIIALLAGLGEELLFRGAIQAAAAQWVSGPAGPWLGLAVASVVFGLAHLITPAYATFAALMGAYLGLVWMWSGNLMIPIVAHAMYDFLALLYLVKWRCSGSPGDATLEMPDTSPRDHSSDTT
jgi:membrane protease YdiL (CAAX protease family)